jgi:hypothetical protein
MRPAFAVGAKCAAGTKEGKKYQLISPEAYQLAGLIALSN